MNLFSIIVTYNPNLANLKKLVEKIISSNIEVILIDNTEISYIKGLEIIDDRINVISNDDNLGIAKAQNIGIKKSLELGANAIIFFDQDSNINENFINNLTSILEKDKAMVFSPVFYDEEKGFMFPSMKINRFGLLASFYPKNHIEPFQVDFVISSGMLITAPVFKRIGMMDENYFIDFVDIEWCLRCKKNNIPIFTIPNAIMLHTIGNKTINFFIFRVSVHTPIRTYYKVRNSFIFFKNKNVSIRLGLSRIIINMIHNFITCLIVKDKKIYFKHYFRAIVDGFMGVKGKKIMK